MFSRCRIWAAVALGAIGCLFIWVAVPYNNFLLGNSFISDSYLPVAAVIFMLGLVLGINPILHLLRPTWALNRRQLALVFAMLLAAAIVPSTGLLRALPWSLAHSIQQIDQSPTLSQAVQKAHIPQALFPDKIGYGVRTPVSDQFLDELDPGAKIPWKRWAGLLPVWLPFLISSWLLMVGVGLVLFPEWRHNERLPFPLLGVYRSIFPDRPAGKVLPVIFYNRLFWVGAGVVMFLYALNGLHHYTANSVPGFPLGWNLSTVFSEVPWRYLPPSIKHVSHIYFILVGMAFFMPNRVSFSIWSFTIGYGLYVMLAVAYLPSFDRGMVTDHRIGAMIAVSFMVLYISRYHWLHVARVMLSRVASDMDRLLRMSGWMVATGALGLFAWLLWAGVPIVLAIVFVWIGFMVSLLIARIVAETGLPFVRIMGFRPMYFMAMMPAGWLSGAAIYVAGFIHIIFLMGSRVSAAVMVSHAAAMDEKASPKHQLRIGYMMLAILVIGLIVCGAVHLYMGYHNPFTLNGSDTLVNAWGGNRLNFSHSALIQWTAGSWPAPRHRLGNLAVGLVLAAGLQFACMRLPRWPLHPIGLLLVGTWYGNMAWASILIGWALKTTVIQLGGARAFRRAQPLFMGIIMGELFSAVIWTLVPVVMLWMGSNPADVGFIPVLPM